MSIVKSLSVGNGDMFYIFHDSDNFTVIDCCYRDDEQKKELFKDIKAISEKKGLHRFISTHPDQDHIRGLEYFDGIMRFRNFYVVRNKAVKTEGETKSFEYYCKLRDSEKAYAIRSEISRCWLNKGDEERDGSGLHFLWPDVSNDCFQSALSEVKNGRGFNNISPIFTYTRNNSVKFIWMGDMETDFLESIEHDIQWEKVDVLFAPHHGRKSGHVPRYVLDKIRPQLIVIGEAPSEELDYYNGYNTIKQNSAGNITFYCQDRGTDIFVENDNYNYDIDSFYHFELPRNMDGKYLASFIPYASQ